MKLHLPVRLFRAVVALMAAVTATCQVYADELPTPTIAPEGYETTQVKTFNDLQYYDWQQENHAYILQDNIEAEWSYQYGHLNTLYTSYYKDYPASMKLIGSIGGSLLNFDHLGTLRLLDDRESYNPSYHYFGISAGMVTFNDVERVHLEGWGTAIHVEWANDAAYSGGLTMQNCGDITFMCSPKPTFSEEYDSQYESTLCGIGVNHWSDSKYDAVVLANNGQVSFSEYRNGAIVCGESNSNVVLSGNEGVSFNKNYRVDGSAGITSQFLTISSNGGVLFDANRTESSGAAIYAVQLSMMNNGDVTFRNNEAQGQGGAICLNDYYENVDAYIFINNNKHVTFENNKSNGGGGAIYTYAYSENYKGSIDNNESVIFRENSSIGNGGALSVNAYCIDLSISGNKTVVFEGNEVQSSDDSYVYGGAIYVCGQSWENNQTTVRISDNGSVIFRNNQAYEGSAIYVDCWYSYLVDLSRNQSIDIASNGGISAVRCDVTMNDNGSINISYNEQDAINGKVSMYGNDSVLFENNGGVAVHGEEGEFINNGTICFKENRIGIQGSALISGNDSVIFEENNNVGKTREGAGGGINGATVVLENNRYVLFRDNVTEYLGYYQGSFDGAAISAKECIIQGNSTVIFEDNAVRTYTGAPAYGGTIYANELTINDNESVYLTESYWSDPYGAIYVTDLLSIHNNGSFIIDQGRIAMNPTSSKNPRGVCEMSAAYGSVIKLSTGVTINAAVVNFNDVYTKEGNEEIAQTGDIIFSGVYAQQNNYSESAINKLINSTFASLINLHDGRLVIEGGAIINGKGITVHSSVSGESTPTLLLNNGVLLHDKSNITMESGTSLSLKGANSITAAAVVLESGSNLSFTLSGDNLTTAALTLTGALNVAEGVTLTLGSSDELLEDGRYILLSLSDGKQPTSWAKDNITISSVGWWRIGYDDLQWQDGQLSVELSYTEWTNATGNALWNMASANWQKQAETTRITPGAALFFGDTGAGVVTVEGEQAPGHIIVDNSEGVDYLWQAAETGGTLMGAARLVKRGKGELTINLDNSYSGGTVLYDGVLTAGTETAFGTGDITVHGGVLNLDGHALENNITAMGGTLAGASACGGTLLVDGDVTLADDSTFGGVSIQSGSIVGGALVDTSVVVNAGGQDVSIESDLVGSGSLVINGGQVVLKGENNYTGGTVINNGSLTLDNGSGLGSGDITLNGGWLDLKGNDPQGNLTINGGSLVSGYVLTEGNTLTVGAQGMKMLAEMTLAGGRIHFEGTILEAMAGVSAIDVTTISVANVAMVDAEGTVLLADFGEHALQLTADSFLYDGYGKLVYDEAAHTLSVELTDVNKWAAVKGAVWTNGDSSAWEDGATFVTGNRVVFDKDCTVTIAGEVEPASVLVDVATSLSFKTTYDKKLATWSGAIVGSGCVVKRGNGVLTLNDGNTYSGGTYIEGGAVIAGGAGSFGTGSITISGDYLDLKSKAVANDITLTGAATIKGGKSYLGAYSQTGGELLKGSVLNIAESATISGGVVNGTLSGTGAVSVTGAVELGESGKITTDKLMVSGSLAVSNKGLAMNAKTSAIEINGGMLASKGKISAASLRLNGGSLSLSGALSVKDLTLGSGTLTLNSAKLATVKVGNSLTLEGDTTLNFGFNVTEKDVAKGKSYKVFTFKTIDTSITDAELNELLGLGTDAATLSFDKNRKAITLTVTDADAWNAYAADVREEALAARRLMALRPAAGVDPMLGKVADTLVQSTWGTAGASRAFGDTIAARGTHATEFASGKGTAWISTMGGSSRISSDGAHAGADYTLTGAAFGMEARLSESSTVGLAIGNSWGKVSTFSAFPVDQDSTHQGIYGKHLLGSSTTLSWMAAHTRTESDAKLAGMDCDWTQDALQLDARVDKLFAISDRTTVSAFVGMQYLATDKGECNGLSSGSLQNLRGEIGVSATHKATDRTYVYGELSFIGDMVRNNPTATVGDYRSRGANPGRAGLNLSVGAGYQLNDSWSLNGSYSLELMQNQTSHSANVGATYSF